MPWGTPTVSDATKLGVAKIIPTSYYGLELYELLPQGVFSDLFANLNSWDVVDSGGNINLAAGVVSLNGDGVLGDNFIRTKAQYGTVWSKWQFDFMVTNSIASGSCFLGLLVSEISANPYVAWQQGNNWLRHKWSSGALPNSPAGYAADTWYTLRIYLQPNPSGRTCVTMTIQGGGFTEETIMVSGETELAIPDPWDLTFNRVVNNANLACVRAVYVSAGLSAAGPTLTYVADAGAGKVIDNFDLTALAAVGGWATTNCTFAWSFDDGVAAYSAEFTLANLNLQGKQLGRHRYARLRITVNSDGATQQYAGEINSDTATDGIGDFPEVNNTYVQDTVQLTAGTLANPTERPECLTTNILNVNQQAFTLGDTVYVNGTLEFVKALAAANVRVRVYNEAGVLQATLFNAAYNFLATTAVTLTAINGGVVLQHIPAAADGYYVEIVITHADLPNGSLTFFSGFGVAAAGGGGGPPPQIRVVDAEQLILR